MTIPYVYLAEAEFSKISDSEIPPPQFSLDADNPWEAARRELVRILEAVYGSLDSAFEDVVMRLESIHSSAEAQEQRIRATEAQRLIATFEKVTSLSDRVARSITRSLKDYRELKLREA